MASQTETLARALFAHYLPRWRQQHNVRPSWLRYPPTGRNLEIDIHFEEQGIAVEVQGAQHGRDIEGMQRDFADFILQMKRDTFKAEACANRGVTLYRLTSFQLLQNNFEPFIRTLMTESEWRRTSPPRKLYRKAEKLTRMKVVRRNRQASGLLSRLLRLR